MNTTISCYTFGIVTLILLGCDHQRVDTPPDSVAKNSKSPNSNLDVRTGPTTPEDFAELAKHRLPPPWLNGEKPIQTTRVEGKVVSVGAQMIEIQEEGKETTFKLPAHDLLASGAICHWALDPECYMLADLQEGDLVSMRVGTVDLATGPMCLALMVRACYELSARVASRWSRRMTAATQCHPASVSANRS